MAKVTLRTIAQRVGVSPMTVSNAFSRPDQLSPELRRRILAVADDIGYAGPNPAARSLSRGRTGTIGILRNESAWFTFTDEHSAILLSAVADELGRRGSALTLLPSVGNGSTVSVGDIAMDGAIVHSCPPASPGLANLRRRGLPLVQLDQRPADDTSGVNIDDRGGAADAARHLLELGHLEIAVVTLTGDDTDGEFYPARQREAGWADVLGAAGLTPRTVRVPGSTVEDGIGAVGEVLGGDHPATAVLAVSDAVAAGIVRGAQDAGLVVPDDLSVVGFDDVPLAGRLRPALTTVAQDVDRKGRCAVELLLDAVEAGMRGEDPVPRREVLEARLVVRASTGPPRD